MRWIILLVLMGSALAAPPEGMKPDPAMRDWYNSLKQPQTGDGCCSIADCRPFDSRIVNDHYEIMLRGRWYTIPREAVLHRENKAGMAIACLRTQWGPDFTPPADTTPDVMCFIPGPQT